MQQGTSARNTSKERQQGTPARNVAARNVEQNILHKGTSWSWVINLFQLTQFALPVLPALHNRHCTFRRPHAPPPPLVHACACYACVLRERVTRVVMRVSPPRLPVSSTIGQLSRVGVVKETHPLGAQCVACLRHASAVLICCSHLLFSPLFSVLFSSLPSQFITPPASA